MPEKVLLACDAVLFVNVNKEFHVLLVKRKYDPHKGLYALPGGFVEDNETVEDAVMRELLEETGITGVSMRRFDTYANPGRDPRGRVVTITFVGIADSDKLLPKPGEETESVDFFPVNRLPDLAFDHKQIINDTLMYLRIYPKI
jgi:8-oxo-dGTP diphosphatase